MPTELAPENLAWIAPDPRHEVLAQVQAKARRIRTRRRLPVATLILAAAALTASAVIPGTGDPASVRTADNDDSWVVDEKRSVEHDDAEVSVSGRAGTRDGSPAASAHASATKGNEPLAGAGIESGPTPRVALTGHPILPDPADDDSSYGSVDGTDTPGENDPATDIRWADMVLDGDHLTYSTHVTELRSFAGRGGDSILHTSFHFSVEGANVAVTGSFDPTFAVVRAWGEVTLNGLNEGQVTFPIEASVDLDASLLRLRAPLAGMNDALARRGSASRVGPGTKAEAPSATVYRESNFQGSSWVRTSHGDGAYSQADSYWEVGS